jgi:Tol biopolymer transport system component
MARTNLLILLLLILILTACSGWNTTPASTLSPAPTSIPRESKIPADAVKISPRDDLSPPILHSGEWEGLVPLPYPVNTAGGEDSPFITPDGQTLYFFFTPIPESPVVEQIRDGVTGYYVTHRQGESWTEPERVILQDPGKLALDGCGFVQDDTFWFCSAREGHTGIKWFTADFVDGAWTNWQPVNFNPDYQVGELHISSDGKELYFHSDRPGGRGGYDLWFSRQEDGAWGPPQNLETLNTPETDGWPFLSEDLQELWFTRTYQGTPALFRSRRTVDGWGNPELIVSQFAGEATLDREGNLIFVHHYYREGEMLEVDLYFARAR